jgi:hypothetical protein
MTKPTHEQIAVRAYFLWQDAGEPEGEDIRFWMIAEMEMMHSWHRIPRRHIG